MKILLALLGAAEVLGTFPAAMVAMMSPMIMDSSKSAENPLAWMLFITTFALPFTLGFSGLKTLGRLRREEPKRLLFISLPAAINLALLGLAILLLQLLCAGRFTC